jgi:hypothetical protein
MSVIVSQGNSPYKVSSGHTDSGDVVISALSRQYAAVGASPQAMTHELGRDTPILSPDV